LRFNFKVREWAYDFTDKVGHLQSGVPSTILLCLHMKPGQTEGLSVWYADYPQSVVSVCALARLFEGTRNRKLVDAVAFHLKATQVNMQTDQIVAESGQHHLRLVHDHVVH
jgi:hypothetical protein